mgnify:FL=1
MHWLLSILILIFCGSCDNPAMAIPGLPAIKKERKLAYVKPVQVKHTKHVRKQQRKICDRLKKIRERLEKSRKRKKKSGK